METPKLVTAPTLLTNNSIVCPLVRFDGDKHLLEEFLEGPEEDHPEYKAVGYMRLNKGVTHGWVSYTVSIKGDKIQKIEISEPDMRQIAEETAKIAFVNDLVKEE